MILTLQQTTFNYIKHSILAALYLKNPSLAITPSQFNKVEETLRSFYSKSHTNHFMNTIAKNLHVQKFTNNMINTTFIAYMRQIIKLDIELFLIHTAIIHDAKQILSQCKKYATMLSLGIAGHIDCIYDNCRISDKDVKHVYNTLLTFAHQQLYKSCFHIISKQAADAATMITIDESNNLSVKEACTLIEHMSIESPFYPTYPNKFLNQ
ncbi:hypothetical protein HL033_04355 [Neoehrlichia mikurensis]|uniref:Uncharacterized protein n=1 Tax=Neoehrlichia mikurensis TaxID=89586 RepID=A0A9Q9BS06_9RICK|nr:hypothetical protein [Neoehrlichia mikurensis]QXK91947.1 hypothetical protein IAH97_04355 [Neoehrlichia mikurensis]QXK93160.1 hypothetical protein HUN61_04350 [Neoehrlichia mikurensis]QXK93639.1 hypothetical protein HL033_04355 [Neoehrlichia mikurensis]UTO55405.1 hypothetical protein LUA82_04500 [Neoehrlichia mikurensis]UTO56324.1 hypothetical protein LUA81_04450 [Neoehrlichia mikurensis]